MLLRRIFILAMVGVGICLYLTFLVHKEALSSSDPLQQLAEKSQCVAWSRIGTLHYVGSTSADGLIGRDTQDVDARSGAYIDRWENGHFPSSAGFNGRVGWTVDRSGAAHQLNSAFSLALAQTDAWILRRGWCAKDRAGARVVRSHQVMDRGIVYDVLSVSARKGEIEELWLDSNSRLQRIVEQQAESRIETRFTSWHDVAGAAIPFKIEQTDMSTGDSSITTWTSVVPGQRLRVATYQPPALPKDFAHFLGSTKVIAHFEGPKIFIDVLINGRGPFPMILDTGGHLILTPVAAQNLGLASVGHALGTGGGPGVVPVRFAKIRELRLGRAWLRNQTVKVMPLNYTRAYRGPRPLVAGVIGQELFERYAVTIDSAKREVSLTNFEDVRPAPGPTLPIYFAEDAPLVDGKLFGKRGSFEIDTGNGGPVIVEPIFARRTGIAKMFRAGPSAVRTGVGGSYAASLGRVDLQIGPFNLPNEGADLVPGAVQAESTVVTAANVGMSVFSRFLATFNYRNSTLSLAPRVGATSPPLVDTGMHLARLGNGQFRVSSIAHRSAAERIGLPVGAIIVAVNGRPSSVLGLVDINQLASASAGRELSISAVFKGKMRIYNLKMEDLVPYRSSAPEQTNH